MAGEAAAKLIGIWASPFVVRARIAFNLKGARYEFLEEKLGTKSELLLRSNPVYKKIPVLLHRGESICESLIIVEYIDATWDFPPPYPILPKDPYDRATARFWAFFVDDKWFPSLLGMLRAQSEEEKLAFLEELLRATRLLEGAFQECSKGKGFFGGDSIGFLDIAFGCYLSGIKATRKMTGVKILDEDSTPLLLEWADRFCAEETVKGVMPDVDRLIEFWKLEIGG